MAINRPTTKTIISTTGWGIPITDQVNANTTDIANVKQGAWANLTLMNGWIQTAAPHPPCRYSKLGNFVCVQIACGNGGSGTVIANLPAGFRPVYTFTFLARGGGSPPQAIMLITTDGNITPYYPSGATTDLCHGSAMVPLT